MVRLPIVEVIMDIIYLLRPIMLIFPMICTSTTLMFTLVLIFMISISAAASAVLPINSTFGVLGSFDYF